MSSANAKPVRIALPGLAWVLGAYAVALLALSPLHRHLTVSVETDFPQYAALAHGPAQWAPFRPVGYPRLLAWTGALTGGDESAGLLFAPEFRAALALSALGGAAVLAAAHALARRALSPAAATYATLLLALNWCFLQNALLAGTDSLWTAAVLWAFELLLRARERSSRDLYGVAGIVLGLSFDLRYATMALAPLFVLVALASPRSTPARTRSSRAGLLAFGIVLGALPQLWIAGHATGNPLANGNAANVWFGTFGHRDWPGKWGEIPKGVTFAAIVLEHPRELLANVARNLGVATRLALTTPFGLVPADVVRRPEAVAAVVAGLVAATVGLAGATWRRRVRAVAEGARRSAAMRAAAFLALGYVLAVSLTFWFPRFFLPVTVLGVMAGAVAARRILWTPLARRPALRTALVLAAPLLLAAHTVTSWTSFLRTQQQPVEPLATALSAAGARADDVIAATVSNQYDALLPYAFAALPLTVRDLEDLQLELAKAGASYFLHEERFDPAGASYHPEIDELLDDPGACPFLEPLWVRRTPPRVILFRAR